MNLSQIEFVHGFYHNKYFDSKLLTEYSNNKPLYQPVSL